MSARLSLLLLLAACSSSTVEPPVVDPSCDCTGRVCGRVECGKSCGVCPDDGVCSADGTSCTPSLPIGSTCSSDLQCGSGRLCLRDATHQPGGYCTRRCGEGDPCPDEAACVFSSDGERVCAASCATAACREADGYGCTEGACLPCVGSCDGKTCGDDGCGGACGVVFEQVPACDTSGEVCAAGNCTFGFQQVHALESDRWDVAAFDLNGTVVLVGGRETVEYAPDRLVRSRGVSRVERWDPVSKQFTTLGALPDPIARPHAALVGNTLYVAGGTVDPDDRDSPDGASNAFFRQNGQSWQRLLSAALPEVSTGGAAASLDGKLYLLPGTTEAGPSNGFWSFDPNTDAWTEEEARPSSRSLFATADDGQRLWVIGGWDGERPVATVETWSASKGWERAPDLPVAVASPRAVVAGGRVFVFGGYDGPEVGDLRPFVQSIDLVSLRTQLLGTTWQNLVRQAPVRLRDGRVLLFGGSETFSGTPVPHTEVLEFLVPAK